MDITTRIQNLTIEKRILLSHRLKEELLPQSKGSSKNASITNHEMSREVSDIPNSELNIDGQQETFSSLNRTRVNIKRLVAYLVLSTEPLLTIPATDSTCSSNLPGDRNRERAERGTDATLSELQNFLRERLPDFMIPSVFMVLEQLPRTNTGKVDYQVLPDPPVSEDRSDRHSDSPVTATQQRLQSIWSAALGIDRIGICDNFFVLGGHSLLIAQVVSQIRTHMGVDIALRSLFDHPTIEALSEVIDTLLWTKKERMVSLLSALHRVESNSKYEHVRISYLSSKV